MNITVEQLKAIFGLNFQAAAAWLVPLNQTLEKYSINTPVRVAQFLAQVGHESARLTTVSENLNYSSKGLLTTFSKYFNDATAIAYARQPPKIANRVYAGRYGNGDEKSGDGWKYHGRGLIQVTFKDNYAACGKALGLDLVANPTMLETPLYAALSAGWYWDSKGLNVLADKEDTLGVTKKINGGTNGLDDRVALYAKAKGVLKNGN